MPKTEEERKKNVESNRRRRKRQNLKRQGAAIPVEVLEMS